MIAKGRMRASLVGIGRPSVVADSVVELVRGSRRYELSDWLGNVRVVVSDARVPIRWSGVVVGYRAEVVSVGDYYSFGAEIRARSYEIASVYRYGYQAQERDDEIYGRGASYYYKYRQQDARLGRFWSVDPLSGKYPYYSPYSFSGNRLVDAVEWEGLEVILVNGYNARGVVGKVIGSEVTGKGYWGPGFVEAAQRFFNDYSPITFIDGSSFMGIDQSGHDRWLRGIEYVMRNIQQLDKVYREGGHDFRIVTHSEGAAYGAGVAYALIKAGYNVSMVVHLSPDEPTEFETPEEPYTIQLVYEGDWVVGEERISKGLDRFGVVRHDYSWTEVHGATKRADVLKAVEDLMKVKVHGQVGPDGKVRHRQVEGSAPHGTIFSQVDEKRIEPN